MAETTRRDPHTPRDHRLGPKHRRNWGIGIGRNFTHRYRAQYGEIDEGKLPAEGTCPRGINTNTNALSTTPGGYQPAIQSVFTVSHLESVLLNIYHGLPHQTARKDRGQGLACHRHKWLCCIRGDPVWVSARACHGGVGISILWNLSLTWRVFL